VGCVGTQTWVGLDHGLHMHRRGTEGTTLPVMSIHVGRRSREGQTLPVMSIRMFRRSREGETLPITSICVNSCVCVCDGVSNGGGEQLGRGGWGLELDYHVVFNLKTYLLWGWA